MASCCKNKRSNQPANLANHHTQLDNQKCQANLGDPFGMMEGHFERSSAHFVLLMEKKTSSTVDLDTIS